MKKLYLVLFFLIAISANAQPVITSFSPISGPIGTIVDIAGTNFDTVVANNIVYFGATKAIVNTASALNLNVTVPAGATYQPISVTNLMSSLTGYSLSPFVVTFPCGSITSGSFAPTVNFTVGQGPTYIVSGDLDWDGKADLVAANEQANSISALRNTTTGTTISFAPKVDFPTLAGPIAMAIGDLDGDGKLDIVVANITSNKISVFLNTSTVGVISFSPKVDFSTGAQPISVSIGDLNGDGKPEVVVTDQGPSTVSVFENNSTLGIISFLPRVPLLVGAFYTSYGNAIGDLDGDGKPDIAVTNTNYQALSVLRNTSSGGIISFEPPVNFPDHYSGYYIALGDVDGDDKAEVVVAHSSYDSVSVFRNLSLPGSLAFDTKVSLYTSESAYFPAIGDLDGDSKPDIAVATTSYFRISVLKNTSSLGSIFFNPKVDFITGSGPRCVNLVDLDNDGMPDLAAPNHGSTFGTAVSTLRHLNCVMTETKEQKEDSEVSVFPNPFTSSAIISFSKEVVNGTIKITDVLGREINKVNFSGAEFLFEREGLNDGIYFIQIETENNMITTKKIVVN